MQVNIDNFEEGYVSIYDISIAQREAGSRATSQEEIDRIGEHPEARSIFVSGLDQEGFEYLIERYGKQFEAISFWKNNLVSDLAPLGDLRGLKYLNYFFNQRAMDLWDMSRNVNLRGLAIYDFTRLHSIERIETAPCLEYFALGNRVWSKMEIDSLKPLIHSSVSHFAWWGNKVLDNDFDCLAQSNIKELDMNIGRFTLDQLARLNASIPGLTGRVTTPYSEGGVMDQNGRQSWYFLCKGKRRLEKGRDEAKLEKYLAEFHALIEKYRAELY